jgi:2-polyprenyl-6-hydroxyphenyl methylase/3-demethylubiquinone-9 3-methyltransferase
MIIKEDLNHFKFGENWENFSQLITTERIDAAKQSLVELISQEKLAGKSFMDFGCGSGLFSIAAAELGAWPVIGVDLDQESIQTSKMNNDRWLPEKTIRLENLSVLNDAGMEKLPMVDVGYAWGSLHQTGAMRRAIHNCASRVKPGGIFVIAIYNRHFTSPLWQPIKKLYNVSGKFVQNVMVAIFTPIIALAKFLVTGKNPYVLSRGMNFKHNVIDWVGGYPYEYGNVKELTKILENENLSVEKVLPAKVPTGCNEFVCVKKGDQQ